MPYTYFRTIAPHAVTPHVMDPADPYDIPGYDVMDVTGYVIHRGAMPRIEDARERAAYYDRVPAYVYQPHTLADMVAAGHATEILHPNA